MNAALSNAALLSAAPPMSAALPTPPRLVSVGNVILDLTARVPQLPERGGDVLAESTGITPGGTFNVLVAAARQGLNAAYGGAHGTGPFGDLARAAMRREGIDILTDPIPAVDTGYDVAITDAGGERTFITAVGAEARLSLNVLETLKVDPHDLVYVSGYGLLHPANREAILGWLPQLPAETIVFVDPGPLGHDIPREALEAVLQRADWWSSNLAEAQRSTGADDPAEAAERLVREGFAAQGIRRSRLGVIVRLGPEGCLLQLPGGEPLEVPGFAVDAIDTNGAGDAHAGAFLAALAAGLPPADAARRANAGAAIAVTRQGPATAPTAAELDRFLASRAGIRAPGR